MLPKLNLSNAEISKSIRMKKKKMANSEPDFIDTSPTPDIDAQEAYDIEQAGRVEETLHSPKKISADETMEDETYAGVGVPPMEMKRMERLRKYIDSMHLSSKGMMIK